MYNYTLSTDIFSLCLQHFSDCILTFLVTVLFLGNNLIGYKAVLVSVN